MATEEDAVRRRTALADYRKKLLQHKELDARVRTGAVLRNLNPSSLFLTLISVVEIFFVGLIELIAIIYSLMWKIHGY